MGNSLYGSFDSHTQKTANSYTLEVPVPGMNKKDLRLEAADGVLTIYGHKQQKDIFGWARRTIEFKSTQIIRTIVLPEDADSDSIKAKCRDGLLKISIPKRKKQTTLLKIPVEEAGKVSWWHAVTKPFRMLKSKVGYMMKRFVIGSKRYRPISA